MGKIPQHVAIIMDGNGRWAKAQGKPRSFGHKAGADRIEPLCRKAKDLGIKYLTIYAFSTENWSRSKEEVQTLMMILDQYIKKNKKLAVENDMRVKFIGDRSGLPEKVLKRIHELEELSKDFKSITLLVAFNYGSRDEMIRGVKRMISEGVTADEVTEDVFSSFLDTAGIPDPDLLIRTSGEQRLSNYLLWQLAYAEFYFTPVPWPDFDDEEFQKAIDTYGNRDRRFGGA